MSQQTLGIPLALATIVIVTVLLMAGPLVLDTALSPGRTDWAIQAAPGPQGTPQPKAYLPVVLRNAEFTPQPTPTPTATPTPGPTSVFGMQLGQRFHTIHFNQLQLMCSFCHVSTVETYADPLAQVFNLADRRACLSCHKEGAVRPFYGEEWDQAQGGR